MTDLDKTLREIIISKLPKMAAAMQEDRTDYMVKGADEAVALVKQAFADEGYQKYSPLGQYSYEENKRRMTGQEWYDRLWKEMPQAQADNNFLLSLEDVDEAAKKAAGINNVKE